MFAISRRLAIFGAVAGASGCEAPSRPPAPGALMAEAAFPAIGSSWTVRSTNALKNTTSDIRRNALSTTHRGRPAYGIQAPGIIIVRDPRNFNVMAIRLGPKETLSNDPDDGSFDWPLWEGKTWTAAFTSVTPGSEGPTYQTVFRKVSAVERVTVPAGTFTAFRIDVAPGAGSDPGARTSTWYAPEVRSVIKEVHQRSARASSGILDLTIELVTVPTG